MATNPTAALCPACGAPLSEVSILALAPICGHCGVVITGTGGTLGLLSAYGVSDPSITRRRVEADLAVFDEYRLKYEGMTQACVQQLAWDAERYAKLPTAPEYLEVQATNTLLDLAAAFGILALVGVIQWTLPFYVFFDNWIDIVFFGQPIVVHGGSDSGTILFRLLILDPAKLVIVGAAGFGLLFLLALLLGDVQSRVANGNRPDENARRRTVFEQARAAALQTAKLHKAAEDHRLRLQIRELEGAAKTVAAKGIEVRRMLAVL